jgi:acetyltransferase-like isoleucine patch superfamily enzyme
VLNALIEWLVRGIPGGLGQRIRYAYYRLRLGRCGRNVRIDEWVIFQNLENIEIGDDVWIFSHSVLTAPGPEENRPSDNKRIIQATGDSVSEPAARLRIGNEVQVGLYNVLNGIGGLEIGNCATLSARVSVYSATHLAYNPNDRAMRVGANGMVRSRPVFSKKRSIRIGDGAWLGLGVSVICASVGDDAFVHSGALVLDDVAANTIASGQPAAPLRERHPATGQTEREDA